MAASYFFIRCPYNMMGLVTIFILCFCTFKTVGAKSCGPGQYLKIEEQYKCLPCPDGTFMPEKIHGNKVCIKCTEAEDFSFEYVADKCTSTTDTVILCHEGWFRYETSPHYSHVGQCKPCTNCSIEPLGQYEALNAPCKNYSDAQCCENENMIIGPENVNSPTKPPCVNPQTTLGLTTERSVTTTTAATATHNSFNPLVIFCIVILVLVR